MNSLYKLPWGYVIDLEYLQMIDISGINALDSDGRFPYAACLSFYIYMKGTHNRIYVQRPFNIDIEIVPSKDLRDRSWIRLTDGTKLNTEYFIGKDKTQQNWDGTVAMENFKKELEDLQKKWEEWKLWKTNIGRKGEDGYF